MHPFGDQVPPTLEHHRSITREVDADIRAVELLFHYQGMVGDETSGLIFSQMFVVIGPSGPE